MNRNVTIVVILLIFAVIAAYLVWLRGQFQQQMSATTQPTEMTQTPPTSAMTPSPDATASAKDATAAAKPKTATPSSNKK